MEIFLLPLLIVIMLSLPVLAAIKRYKSGKKLKTAMVVNLCSFFAVLLCAVIFPVTGFVGAENEVAAEAAQTAQAVSAAGWGYLAAALATGLGSIGCGIAVASAAPAAIGAVSEEPGAFGKALIFVALGEGVALYGFLISFMILSKL